VDNFLVLFICDPKRNPLDKVGFGWMAPASNKYTIAEVPRSNVPHNETEQDP